MARDGLKTANRSASFNSHSSTSTGLQVEGAGPVRRTESLPVNASTRNPNRVDVGVSTAGLRAFVEEGRLPPNFAAMVQRPLTSMAQYNGDSEKVIAESPYEVSPMEIDSNSNGNDLFSASMFTKPNRARDAADAALTESAISRRADVATVSPVDSRDECVSVSRTSRHARRMSTPKPILKLPGRSLPDVGTANITVHAHETIQEEPMQRTLNVTTIRDEEATQAIAEMGEEHLLGSGTLPATLQNDRTEEDTTRGIDLYEEDFLDDDDDDDNSEAELAKLTENVNAINLNKSLDPFIIAHDRDAVIRMNTWDIAWGVQYEIARGVSQKMWTWEDVTDARLELLQGSNLEKAPLVTDVFGKGCGTLEAFLSAEKIFGEMDREQKAKLENIGRGLGLRGPWEGVEDWYGGRIQQVARLRRVPGSHGYSLTLEKMQLGKSNRVTRFAGSRSILQIRMDQKLVQSEGDKLIEFLARRQVVCGRIFHPFFAKENKIYLVECNEDLDRRPKDTEGDQFRLSWNDFIAWHNPLRLNREQPISKWSTRWALVLSTSKPVIEFDPQNIFFIDDIYANGGLQGVEEIMTDGCGFVNMTALRMIAILMKLPILPVVIQGRLAGAKGLWLLHPAAEHRDLLAPPKIWIRKSQNKIKLPPLDAVDRSHHILDLVRLPRLTKPSGLNKQTITNLSSNGVPDDAIKKLLADGLLSEIEPLASWTGPNARTHLGRAVENAGKVVGGRRSRQAGLEARAFTYIKEESDDNTELGDDVYQGGLIDRLADSGCPISLYESSREMLQAGFSPLSLPYLRGKLTKIVEMVTERYVGQFHITVPGSVEAFIVPDPFGVLEEGEIYFRCSEPIGEALTIDPASFSGSVLVMRNPTMVASDVQKVNIVSRDELLPYVDVIICSTKGPQSLASYLGGGDYDGDTVTILAERSIVDTFKNAETVREPTDLRENFQPEIEKVSVFCDRVRSMDGAYRAYELSKKLLSGLSESKVGLYSRFHENVVYSHGYSHADAIRLAYMFTTCLDSTKSGLKLKDKVYEKDSKKFMGPQPPYVQEKQESEMSMSKVMPENARRCRRPSLGPFVLDTLRAEGESLQCTVLAHYKDLCDNQEDSHDSDLLEPYKRITSLLEDPVNISRLSFLADELVLLREHVQNVFWKYKDEISAYDGRKKGPKSTEGGISRRSLVQNSVTEFWSGLSKFKNSKALLKPEEYMASYAYHFSFKCGVQRNSTYAKDFPFLVAHKELCAIKASACGMVAVTLEYADYLMTHSSLLKTSIKAAG